MKIIPFAVRKATGMTAWLSLSLLMLTTGSMAGAAEVKVMSADVLTPVLTSLVAEFERTTKHRVSLVLATTGVVRDRVRAGEYAEVAIMQRPAILRLAQDGKVLGDTIVDLGRSSVGVGVRAGAPRPDLGSVEAFKRSLLAAKSIGYTDPSKGGGSGAYFGALVERLGLAKQLQPKTRYPGPGHSAADLIAEGDIDFGIAQPMEILAKPGLELAGVLPAELQDPELFVFSAGVLQNAREPAAAKSLIEFLSGPRARAAIKQKGMDPG
jgi:molybdate transport system substrate-binding protein